MKKFLNAKFTGLFLAISLTLCTATWGASCDAFNSETGSYVFGECYNYSFDGFDSETGAYVFGDCYS